MESETLIDRVDAIYRKADEHVARFAERSGWKCPTVCGRCCESPFIEASPLECLPLAHSLLPKAEYWEEALALFLRRNRTLPSPCPFYVTFGFGKGFCSVYEQRPLICRLFGFAAFRDEAGREQFDTCHYHKEKKDGPSADRSRRHGRPQGALLQRLRKTGRLARARVIQTHGHRGSGVDRAPQITEPDMSPRFTGGCLCRQVQYEVNGKIGSIVHCHCSMCRKWHGSAFRTRATASSAAFRWTAGESQLGRYPSSKNLTKTFCRNCGSSLVTFYEHMPELVGIALGTMNEDPGERPQFHVFVASKAPWYEITDDLPQYDEFPQDPKEVYRVPDSD